MNVTHNLKRIIGGTLVSGGVAVAGLGLAAGTAQAAPGFVPLAHWCPGDPVQQLPHGWDQSVCHDYYWTGPDAQNPNSHAVEGVAPPRMCGPVPCGLFP